MFKNLKAENVSSITIECCSHDKGVTGEAKKKADDARKELADAIAISSSAEVKARLGISTNSGLLGGDRVYYKAGSAKEKEK